MRSIAFFSVPAEQLDEHAARDMKECLLPVSMTMQADELYLDLSRVQWMGSTALSLIISLHQQLKRRGKHLVVRNVSPGVAELLQLTRLDTLLDVRAVKPQQCALADVG